MKRRFLSPSLLSADFSNLAEALSQIESASCKFVHIDVMDGHFVPEITYGQAVIRSLRKRTDLIFDVHLMVEKPEYMVDSFASAGADFITFHLESCVHANALVQKIHALGKKAGVAIVPSTPVDALSELLSEVDLILVMTVNPGFGGQKMIPSCVEKVKKLEKIRTERGLDFLISVDGGVNNDTVSSVVNAGADVVVSGSAFFRGDFNWNFAE